MAILERRFALLAGIDVPTKTSLTLPCILNMATYGMLVASLNEDTVRSYQAPPSSDVHLPRLFAAFVKASTCSVGKFILAQLVLFVSSLVLTWLQYRRQQTSKHTM